MQVHATVEEEFKHARFKVRIPDTYIPTLHPYFIENGVAPTQDTIPGSTSLSYTTLAIIVDMCFNSVAFNFLTHKDLVRAYTTLEAYLDMMSTIQHAHDTDTTTFLQRARHALAQLKALDKRNVSALVNQTKIPRLSTASAFDIFRRIQSDKGVS